MNNLAWLLRIRGDFTEAELLYRRTLAIAEGIDVTARSRPILTCMATAHNELAFYMDVPAKRWQDAENHYRQAIDLLVEAQEQINAANVELNLQKVFHLSEQPVDVEKVKELTSVLEAAGDPRAEKGRKLLQELE